MKKTSIILSIMYICLFLIGGLASYCEYEDYQLTKAEMSDIINNEKENEKELIKSILYENRKSSEHLMNLKAREIQDTLLIKYPDKEQLQNDILYPDSNTVLSKVLDNSLKLSYVNIDDVKNKPFVASAFNILWCDGSIINESSSNSWFDLKSFTYNRDLATTAMNSIRSVGYNNYIYWQCGYSDDPISAMTIDSLYDLYIEKDNIEVFKNYEMLVPIYITKTGDIFGVRDYDNLGQPIHNYKIIIVQRVNIYDALSNHTGMLKDYRNNIYNLNIELYRLTLNKIKIISASCIIIFIFFGIIAYVQNNIINKKDRRC